MIYKEPIKRDQFGFFFHSVLDNLAEETPITSLPEAEGMIFYYVAFDNDVSEEVLDKYIASGSPDVSFWEPTSPGDSYFLIAIYDTEDGPYACFGKPKPSPSELTDQEIFNYFVSDICYCGKAKKSKMSHCRSCYHALPPEAKRALYKKFFNGYEESFRNSLEILNGK